MPDYKTKNGDVVFVEDKDVDQFLSLNEGAALVINPGAEDMFKEFIPKDVEPGKDVDLTAGAEGSNNTASNLDNGSLGQKDPDKDYVGDTIAIDEIEVVLPSSKTLIDKALGLNAYTIAENTDDVNLLYEIEENAAAAIGGTLYNKYITKDTSVSGKLKQNDQSLQSFAEENGDNKVVVFSDVGNKEYKQSLRNLKLLTSNLEEFKIKSSVGDIPRAEKLLDAAYAKHNEKYKTTRDNVFFYNKNQAIPERLQKELIKYKETVPKETRKENVLEFSKGLSLKVNDGANKLFDEDGNTIYDEKQPTSASTASEEPTELQLAQEAELDKKAVNIATFSSKEELEDLRGDIYGKLVVAIKDLSLYYNSLVEDEEAGEISASTPIGTKIKDFIFGLAGQEQKGDNLNYARSKAVFENFKPIIDYVNKNNKLPEDLAGIKQMFGYNTSIAARLSRVKGDGDFSDVSMLGGMEDLSKDLSSQFNYNLDQFIVLNKALETNKDILSVNKANSFEEAWDAVKNVVGLDDITTLEERQIMKEILSGYNFDQDKIKDIDVSPTFSETASRKLVTLIEFVAKFALLKKGGRMAGIKSANVNKTIVNATRNVVPGALAQKAIVNVSKAIIEGSQFVGVTGLTNFFGTGNKYDVEKENPLDSFGGGFALGISGGIVRGVIPFLSKKFATSAASRFLLNSKIIRGVSDSKLAGNFAQSVAGANVAAATVVGSSLLMNPSDFDWSHAADEYAMECMNMFALGKLTSGMTFRGGNTFTRARELAKMDIQQIKGINAVSEKAGKILNVQTEVFGKPTNKSADIVDKATEIKLEEIKKELAEDKITDAEAETKIENINEAKNAVTAQIDLNFAKQAMEVSGVPMGEQVQVSNMLKNGTPLTSTTSLTVSNMSAEAILVAAGREITPISRKQAQNVVDSQTRIQALINGESIYLVPGGYLLTGGKSGEFKAATLELKEQVYEFLQDRAEAGQILQNAIKEVKDKNPELAFEQKMRLERAQANFDNYYEGGGLYDNLQGRLTDASSIRLNESLKEGTTLERDGKEAVTEVANTRDEFQKLSQSTTDVTDNIGMYNGDKMIINQEVANEVRDFTVDKHEKAHFLLLESLKDKDGFVSEEGIGVIENILSKLTTKERALLDVNVASRYDTSKSKKYWYEEYIAVLSEFMDEGRVTKKSDGSFSDALKGLIPALKRKYLKNLNVDSVTGEGMYEMLESLNSKNKKTKLAAEKLANKFIAKEGEKVSKKTPVISKDSKQQLTPEQDKAVSTEVMDLQVIKKENKELAAKYGKEPIKGGKETKLENKILESIKPIVDRVVTDRTKALYDPIAVDAKKSVSRQDFQESMRNDIQTMVLDEFNGKQNVEKFIVNRAFLRANNLAQRLGIKSVEEGINKGLEAAEKVAVDEAKTVEKDVKLTKATKILSEDQLKQAKEIIIKAEIKDKNISYKKLKGLTAKVVSEVTGIPEGKIGNPAKNLSKPETTTAAMFIEKNVDYIRRTLPDGFVSKGASSNLIGTSTGVPKSLLNAFYVKGKRGDNLSPFKLRKGVTNNEILESIGRSKDSKPTPIDPRSDKGSVIKAFIDLVDKNITNELIRTERDLTIQQQADAGAGRGRNVFSKKANLKQAGIQEKIKNIVTKEGERAIDPKDFENRKEDVDYMYNDFFPKLFKEFGPETLSILKGANIAPSGNVGESTYKRGQIFINDLLRVAKGNAKQRAEAAVTAEMINSGELGEMSKIIKLYKKFEAESILESKIVSKNIKIALASQNVSKLAKNLNNIKEHQAGYKEFLNLWKKLYDTDNKNIKGIQYLMYNQNANAHFYRNLAQLTGIEVGLKKGQAREEHVYQAGVWAFRTLEAMTSKNPKVWKGWLDWSSKNYFQEAIKGAKSSLAKGEYTQSEVLIDKTYTENRFDNKISVDKFKAKFEEHPLLKKSLDEAMKTGDFSKVLDVNIRKYNEYFTLNPNVIIREGVSDAKRYGVEVDKSMNIQDPSLISEQGRLIFEVITSKISKARATEEIKEYEKIAKSVEIATSVNNSNLGFIKYSKPITNKQSIEGLSKLDKSLDIARKNNVPVKKIRVFDFDDTLARTKSKIGYTMPDGTTGKIDAATFARDAGTMESNGAEFDFSEFSKVMNGKKGPLFEVAKIIADKRGTEDLFVLTARPADAAGPIQEFLKSLGLDIPLKNITGLADGAPEAKAGWVVGKASEGYNDFYFTDDATGNVKAVKEALSVLDVKSKVQLAKVKFSNQIDKRFNEIIENKTGIAAEKNYAEVKGRLVGEKKGRTLANFLLPPSAEDFVGLLYSTLGKGKTGEQQMEFYNESLLKPYSRAMDNITRDKMVTSSNFKALKDELNIVPKKLKKEIPGTIFTKEQAVRVFVWDQAGKDIPGLSKADLKELTDIVKNDAQLQIFATEIIKLNKGTEADPKEGWTAGTITTDLLDVINTTKRSEYLAEWQANADVMFSDKNLNKMEAAFGKSYRDAMQNILGRMKTGTNRTFGGDTLTGRFTDWINGSTGAIMFFNSKSAILQTLSATNFIDFNDNNVFAAGKAFANQPQYWKDFKMLFNSDFLVERRDGLKINVNEADIANAARESGARGVIGKLLKVGFTPTQLADSFAIASGGSTFYRTKVKALMKEGLSSEEAERQAFQEFREKAEESQQSSRPDRISAQQAGPLGRIVLAFANTPAQYARLMKKAASDLKNGRGDAKSNISKIVYYGVAQNLMFNALQQALFSISFGDDEEALKGKDKKDNKKRKEEKAINIVNGMADSILRGTGVAGAIFSVVKNTAIKIYKESEKKNPKYENAALELLKISPPVSSKIQKVRSAARSFSWNSREMKTKGFSLDNPAYLAGGNIVSAAFNIPLDRVIKKINHLKSASDEELETYKRMALVAGWSEWELGIKKKKTKSSSSSKGVYEFN